MMMMTMMAKKTKMRILWWFDCLPWARCTTSWNPCSMPTFKHYGCFVKSYYLQILFGLNFICCPFIKHQAKLRLLSHSVPFLYHVSNSKQVRSVIIGGSTSFGRFKSVKIYRVHTGLLQGYLQDRVDSLISCTLLMILFVVSTWRSPPRNNRARSNASFQALMQSSLSDSKNADTWSKSKPPGIF